MNLVQFDFYNDNTVAANRIASSSRLPMIYVYHRLPLNDLKCALLLLLLSCFVWMCSLHSNLNNLIQTREKHEALKWLRSRKCAIADYAI